jgi:hypothetical protein
MSHRRIVVLTVAGVLASACASSPGASSGDSVPEPVAAWSGSFTATQERSGRLTPTVTRQASGTVRLRRSERDATRTSVSLVVTTSIQEAAALRWAVLPGRCGSASIPLLGHEQFPPLEMGSAGRGQIEIDLPMELPQSGNYHVNVYSGGRELEHVVTCANLRRGG